VGRVLLDGIVREVHEGVAEAAVEAVGLPGKSNVPSPKEVQFHFLSQQGPDSNIKLPLLNQQRSFNVFLDNERTGF
jgi:hypothetical protein